MNCKHCRLHISQWNDPTYDPGTCEKHEVAEEVKTVEQIRAEIDEVIDWLWAEGMCLNMVGNSNWLGHAIIEGLKRARYITGEPWTPDEGFTRWQRFATFIDPPGTWILKDFGRGCVGKNEK